MISVDIFYLALVLVGLIGFATSLAYFASQDLKMRKAREAEEARSMRGGPRSRRHSPRASPKPPDQGGFAETVFAPSREGQLREGLSLARVRRGSAPKPWPILTTPASTRRRPTTSR